MRATQIRPTGVERTLGDDELIVTKTDTQGRITYANDVFLRMSALTEAEALGQPHNLIRHPDMPRAVFKLLWDTLERGHEVFAYVQNLAADGAHYWVLAHVTPSYDAGGRLVGYHSSRRAPEPAAVHAVRQVYADLRAEEQRHTGSRDGLEASWDRLQRLLDERGQTYDEFVWELTDGERR
ncbi:PAS domain-containing protein [Couchioplanes azureus]|uniref:PAS domain-containing protein n=1 Tax=Couchioplanes caeruleus TaxID=56438 RepID=UPI001670A8FB|nr:PAS domain-containing protein [Couchioplanes caeruleus]GGQ38542.1 chemotaxis protein [Couchioplanes caeruleus subsp. azureus]